MSKAGRLRRAYNLSESVSYDGGRADSFEPYLNPQGQIEQATFLTPSSLLSVTHCLAAECKTLLAFSGLFKWDKYVEDKS